MRPSSIQDSSECLENRSRAAFSEREKKKFRSALVQVQYSESSLRGKISLRHLAHYREDAFNFRDYFVLRTLGSMQGARSRIGSHLVHRVQHPTRVITLCNYACRILSGMCDRNAMYERGSAEVLKISPEVSSSVRRSSPLDRRSALLSMSERDAVISTPETRDQRRPLCDAIRARDAPLVEIFSIESSGRLRAQVSAQRANCAALNFMDCRSVKDGARIKSDGRKRLNQPWRCPVDRR